MDKNTIQILYNQYFYQSSRLQKNSQPHCKTLYHLPITFLLLRYLASVRNIFRTVANIKIISVAIWVLTSFFGRKG
ncbi:hypothetical protein VNO77_14538 [Canavalia gladiata]|uniref:Uncharacterized protein n=1 Tax=Canavalia gladiata TaxID=3824 RepID=A0AAN9LY86_CANGL